MATKREIINKLENEPPWLPHTPELSELKSSRQLPKEEHFDKVNKHKLESEMYVGSNGIVYQSWFKPLVVSITILGGIGYVLFRRRRKKNK